MNQSGMGNGVRIKHCHCHRRTSHSIFMLDYSHDEYDRCREEYSRRTKNITETEYVGLCLFRFGAENLAVLVDKKIRSIKRREFVRVLCLDSISKIVYITIYRKSNR
jgi:hypothetical protein